MPENQKKTSNPLPCHSAAESTIPPGRAPDLPEALAEMRGLIGELHPGPQDALRSAWLRLEAALSGVPCDCQEEVRALPAHSASDLNGQTSLLRSVTSRFLKSFAGRTEPVDAITPTTTECEHKELFHSIVENSAEGIYRRNLRLNRYDYLSPALERITGIDIERFAQLDNDELIEMMHPDDRGTFREEMERSVGGEGTTGGLLEYRLLPAGGTCRWISDSYSILRDAAGKPAYRVGNLRDVTGEKNAALAAHNSEETLKALIELMPVGVCLVGFDGRFQYLNRFFLDTFGYDLTDIPDVQHWFLKAYPDPEYRAKVSAVFKTEPGQTMENGAAVPLRETLVTCKDGSVRHVIFNRQLTQNYRVITLTDITEREKLHNELLKLQKIESLGVLAGGIAHDFNNILTGIVGNISLARLLFDAQDWSSELLENAESESQRAVKLAGQLLTFAKGGSPVKKLVSAGKLLGDTVCFALGGANVNGAVSVPDTLHAVEADEGQLGQAFSNIVINALQAMPDGGTLSVAAENLLLGAQERDTLPAGDYLQISFRDEGFGIPPEDQQRIFDPYFSTKPGAAGLGLATAHSIVTRHGGDLAVSSEPGKGACFTMRLPSTGAPFPKSAPQRRLSSTAYGAGGSILLMDDEKVIRNIASKMLECLSYQVTTCNRGEDAISLFREAQEAGTPYRTVIMDLTVAGGMGGKEAARHILALDPAACLIVSSGYSNDPVLADFKGYGFHAAMPKPYRLSDMEEVLASVP